MIVDPNEPNPLTDVHVNQWNRDGYTIVRGLWTPGEIAACKTRFDTMAEKGEIIEGHWQPDLTSEVPLRRFPRVLHPHAFDALSMRMLLDARVGAVLSVLMGEEPIATQSMFYYKPPGGKGQALHQDNYYLRVHPHTCVAAWTAIDRSHPENGGLYVCPGTQNLDVACPELANPEESFTTHLVRPPAGVSPVPAVLDPGDVLFFNGSIVHGSKPNSTAAEWRRSFICHYAPISSRELASDYKWCYRMDGSAYQFEEAEGGGPCGVEFPDGWVPTAWDEAVALGMEPVDKGSIT